SVALQFKAAGIENTFFIYVIVMLSYLFKKLNKISLLHRINNLGIQDYCLLNNLLTEIL
ncbi:hypothetical protein L1Z57_18380, partial [Acinetobacter baumannii]|nr:hypothetical protein [Acinetobacter baumannii]